MTDKQIFVKDINVSRKEQIIIDGVDVSECEFYVHYDYGKFPHGCSLHKDMFGMPACCDVADCCKNCYFKQLARKTQECEELKIKLMQKDEVNTFFNTPIEGWSSNPCDICENKNNYEQLKEELDKEHLLMLEKQDKATRYFLVLNRIKEYIYNNTDFDVNDSIQSKTSGYDILQIIKDV